MAKLPEGLTVAFQGHICTPEWELERQTGLEPDFGFVHIPREELGKFKLEELEQRQLTEIERDTDKRQGLDSIGTLIVSEVRGDQQYDANFEKIIVTDRAIESVIAFDDDSAIARIQITDIRWLWGKEGIVSGWINFPKQGVGQKGGDGALPGRPVNLGGGSTVDKSARDSLGGFLASPDQGSSAAVVPPTLNLKNTDCILGSLDDLGQLWTLRRVIEVYILPNLPGKPKLTRMPKDLENSIVSAKIWDCTRTKAAFAELLEEFRLVLALNPDASVSLWKEGEGELQDEKFTKIEYDVSQQDVDDRVSNARELVALNFVPRSVIVVGPPVIETASFMGLEPVGEVGGHIVPLAVALKNLNLTPEDAGALALDQGHEHSTRYDIDTDGLKRFHRWYCKWFRLPGGPAANAGKLPMLERGRVDSIGQFLPIRVWSESFRQVNVAALVTGKGAKTSDKKTAAGQALPELKNFKNYIAYVNLPFSESSEGFKVYPDLGLIEFEAIQAVVGEDVLDLPSFFPAKKASLRVDLMTLSKQEYQLALEKYLAEVGEDQEAEKEAIREALKGNAAVGALKGALGAAAIGGAFSTLEAVIKRPARVAVEWGYARKPSLEENVSIEHRYYSFWIRTTNGDDKPLAVKSTYDTSHTPQMIARPDLQQVVAENGDTNKVALDAISDKLARQVLEQSPVTEGAVIKLHRPTPVINTGLVRSIRWGMQGGVPGGSVPVVEIHLGMIGPLARNQEFNRAPVHAKDKGGPSVIHKHVAAPKGVTQ